MFVLPTEYEAVLARRLRGSGLRLPVVATRVNGIEDLVVDGETGLLVTRSPGDVAQALLSPGG